MNDLAISNDFLMSLTEEDKALVQKSIVEGTTTWNQMYVEKDGSPKEDGQSHYGEFYIASYTVNNGKREEVSRRYLGAIIDFTVLARRIFFKFYDESIQKNRAFTSEIEDWKNKIVCYNNVDKKIEYEGDYDEFKQFKSEVYGRDVTKPDGTKYFTSDLKMYECVYGVLADGTATKLVIRGESLDSLKSALAKFINLPMFIKPLMVTAEKQTRGSNIWFNYKFDQTERQNDLNLMLTKFKNCRTYIQERNESIYKYYAKDEIEREGDTLPVINVEEELAEGGDKEVELEDIPF